MLGSRLLEPPNMEAHSKDPTNFQKKMHVSHMLIEIVNFKVKWYYNCWKIPLKLSEITVDCWIFFFFQNTWEIPQGFLRSNAIFVAMYQQFVDIFRTPLLHRKGVAVVHKMSSVAGLEQKAEYMPTIIGWFVKMYLSLKSSNEIN